MYLFLESKGYNKIRRKRIQNDMQKWGDMMSNVEARGHDGKDIDHAHCLSLIRKKINPDTP